MCVLSAGGAPYKRVSRALYFKYQYFLRVESSTHAQAYRFSDVSLLTPIQAAHSATHMCESSRDRQLVTSKFRCSTYLFIWLTTSVRRVRSTLFLRQDSTMAAISATLGDLLVTNSKPILYINHDCEPNRRRCVH